MAQEVHLMGATYSDVPSVLLPDSNNTLHSFVDTSDATATASEILSGYTAYSNGTKVTGTASGGGSSSWTLVASTSYTISTTKTSMSTIATWETGDTSIWTSDSIVYVRIRDTAGPRAGYFYGSDIFIINHYPVNGTSSTYNAQGTVGVTYYYDTSNHYQIQTGYRSTAYGVWCDNIYSDGGIRVRARYNSSNTLTIDGTFSFECYLLTPPATIFG